MGLSDQRHKLESPMPEIEEYHPFGAEYAHFEVFAFEACRACTGNRNNRAIVHAKVESVVNIERCAVIVKAREHLNGPGTGEEGQGRCCMAHLRVALPAPRYLRIAVGSRPRVHIGRSMGWAGIGATQKRVDRVSH